MKGIKILRKFAMNNDILHAYSREFYLLFELYADTASNIFSYTKAVATKV